MQRWDVFCRVVDNFGDIGVCWRLSRQLADEFDVDVRLWVDDLHSFSRLCPNISVCSEQQSVGPIEVRHWLPDFPVVDVADVVIEAFACELPTRYVEAMARKSVAPVWINLEYLSAEDWVDDCHLLKSPHPTLPLTKTFFFPGFTQKTGGLLREWDLLRRRALFDQDAVDQFWGRLGVPPKTKGEVRISLFCYANPALPTLLQSWADGPDPVRILATPGAATDQISAWLQAPLVPGMCVNRGSLTLQALPFLAQPVYDQLLWACDVNFVRGEDSFVRAQWAQRPFVWQIYTQTEGAHLTKLNAFLTRYLGEYRESEVVRSCWLAWNGVREMVGAWWDFAANLPSIEQYGKDWACQLDQTDNLANNLSRFVRGH